MVIYKTTNNITGKIYIGQDSKNDPEYLGSGKILKQSIQKYGIQNFTKEIIETCETKELLNEREIYWISYFNSCDRNIGYNIAFGGNGGDTISNHPRKDEISQAHSKWMEENNPTRGRKKPQQEIDKWRESYDGSGENNGMFGKNHTEESKERISIAKKEYWDNLTEEDREKLSYKLSESLKGKESFWKGKSNTKHSEWMKENNPMKGKSHTEESKEKMSNSHIGKIFSETHKQNIAKSKIGNKPTNSIKIEIDGKMYDSLAETSRITNIPLSTIRNRIKSNNPKYINYKRI